MEEMAPAGGFDCYVSGSGAMVVVDGVHLSHGVAVPQLHPAQWPSILLVNAETDELLMLHVFFFLDKLFPNHSIHTPASIYIHLKCNPRISSRYAGERPLTAD